MKWMRRLRVKRVPFCPQMEVTECGPACLAMILAHHGHQAPLPELRAACSVSRDGASAASIIRAARNYGLEALGQQIEIEALGAAPLPAILHWEFNHFVVLTGVSRRRLEILDPALGPRFVSREQASNAFTGITLTFQPGPQFRKRAAQRRKHDAYLRLFMQALPGVALSGVGTFILELVGLAFPVASQVAIDYIIRPKQPRLLIALGATLLAATLLRFALALARDRLLAGLRMSLDIRLMTGFIDHLTRLPLEFLEQRSVGDLANRAEAHTAIREVIRNLSTTVLDSLLILSYSLLMVAYDARMGALVILVTALRAGAVWLVQQRVERDAATEVVAEAREASVLMEAFSAPECIQAFGTAPRVQRRFLDAATRRVNAAAARERVEYNAKTLLAALDGLCLAGVYWFGGLLVSRDEMTLGVLSAFVAMLAGMTTPMKAVVQAVAAIPQLQELSRRLDDVWEATPERQGGVALDRLRGSVRLDSVSVRRGNSVALRKLSLHLSPGECVAIVGPSGSGKTTLARLIAGLLAPSSGAVHLDGHSLDDLNRAMLYEQVSLVRPEPVILDATVHDNIALGDDRRPIEAVMQAARDACVDADIAALRDGYETTLGRAGVRLSGGQAQRICIARALLKAPCILILDEATSSLDPDLESRILEHVGQLECTRIIITHRAAPLQRAERVIVMDGGQLVDDGPLAAVLERCEVLRRMLGALDEVTA
jgi:ABC-type bacteriocin/lantibiotic exporter with double-glycine peptidase domain